jgi:DNA-binding transcriptional regulator/RsmH inhibitor MraZ
MAMLMGRRPTGGEVGTTLTIVELDEKGRLLLPASLRRKLGARRFEVGLVAGRVELAPIQDVKALEGKYRNRIKGPWVKLDESRKQALDRFLASLIVEEGVKVSLQEILGLMVDYSLESRDKLVKRMKKLPRLEDDPTWRMLKEPDDWGVADASEKIDEYLYSERHSSVR